MGELTQPADKRQCFLQEHECYARTSFLIMRQQFSPIRKQHVPVRDFPAGSALGKQGQVISKSLSSRASGNCRRRGGRMGAEDVNVSKFSKLGILISFFSWNPCKMLLSGVDYGPLLAYGWHCSVCPLLASLVLSFPVLHPEEAATPVLERSCHRGRRAIYADGQGTICRAS